MKNNIKRGDIYFARLNPIVGSEQGGKHRPVLIISNNKGNRYSTTVIVAAITGMEHNKANLPTHVIAKGYEFLEKGKIAEQDSEYYTKILDSKMQSLIKNDSNERDLAEAKKRKEKIQSSIATQVRNLREADETIKKYIQDDITALSDELAQAERIIAKLEQAHQGQQDLMKGLSEVKKTLLNFNSLVADMEYEDKLSLLTTLIERIIVAPNDTEEICHIFIKGCSNEEYDDFFRESEDEMCDLDRYSKCHP